MSRQLYLAIPTHSGTIATQTAITLLELQALAGSALTIRFAFHSASVISDLRNVIVADFLAGGFDDLFMLDSDQGLSPHMILRMLQAGFPVTGCLYPRRNYFWSNVRSGESTDQLDRVLKQAMRFVGELLPDPDGQIRIVNGFAKARYVGGGAMLIRRRVLEQMMLAFPELAGKGFSNEDENSQRAAFNWGFFNPIHDEASGRNLGEDVSFCERWRSGCNGEIQAEVTVDCEHVGRQVFRGNYLDHLRAQDVLL